MTSLCGLILLALCCATVQVIAESVELLSSQEQNANVKFQNIYTLDGHCVEGKCSGFRFGNASVVAYFDLQAKVRIKDSATYDIINPVDHKSLVFENCTFAHFPMQVFYALDVQELDMRNCSVQLLTWENFLMAGNLKVLLLSQNQIERISHLTFDYASELQYLFLDSNRIRQLYGDSLAGLEKLKYLDLSDNLLKELPDDVFSSLPQLLELSLAGNYLRVINDDLFAGNPKLLTLSLSRNDVRDIEENALKAQTNLMLLDVSHNKQLEQLIATLHVQHLNAANCSLLRVNVYGSVANADMRDNHILELYFAQPETLENLNLSNNSLQQIASLTLANSLRSLDVSDNPDLRSLPDPWMTKSLERLNLSNTGLNVLPISSLAPQQNLRTLDVSHNRLRELNPLNFKYLDKLRQFYIHANDWNCFSLNPLMSMLIHAHGMSYKSDEYDADFPGEYLQGIACMYRLEEIDENHAEQEEPTSAESEPISDVGNEHDSAAQHAAQLSEDPRVEVRELRRELQAIVKFYEQKMDKAFGMISDLDARLQQFERMNASLWQHVTITV